MRFIQEEDYSTLIRTEIRNLMAVSYNDVKLAMAENMAISQIKNYLKGSYDIAIIFEGTTTPPPEIDPRNAYLLMITMDCALYHLYTNTAPDRIPEHRSARYQDAMDWLKMVSKGETIADLPITPIVPGESNSVAGIKLGSKYPKSNNRY
jgi:phage gp36-like protein